MKRRPWLILLAVVGAATLACSLPVRGLTVGTPPPGEQAPAEAQPESEEDARAVAEATQTAEATPTIEPTPAEPDWQPVSVQEGLASLDSYQIQVKVIAFGPASTDRQEITVDTQESRPDDARVNNIRSFNTSADDPEGSESTTETVRVGLTQCTRNDAGEPWEYDEMTAAQKEMLDIFGDMLDLTPVITNPTYVGEEEVNGILTDHFTFKLDGLGVTSGAEVTLNEGEYWLAKDGRYIVRYALIAETQTAPGVDVLHEEIHIELSNVNQPAQISLPADCQPGGEE